MSMSGARGLCENFGIKSCNHTNVPTNLLQLYKHYCCCKPQPGPKNDVIHQRGVSNAFRSRQKSRDIKSSTIYKRKICLHSRLELSLCGDILKGVNRDDLEIQLAINILSPICNWDGHSDLMASHEQLLLSNSC